MLELLILCWGDSSRQFFSSLIFHKPEVQFEYYGVLKKTNENMPWRKIIDLDLEHLQVKVFGSSLTIVPTKNTIVKTHLRENARKLSKISLRELRKTLKPFGFFPSCYSGRDHPWPNQHGGGGGVPALCDRGETIGSRAVQSKAEVKGMGIAFGGLWTSTNSGSFSPETRWGKTPCPKLEWNAVSFVTPFLKKWFFFKNNEIVGLT